MLISPLCLTVGIRKNLNLKTIDYLSNEGNLVFIPFNSHLSDTVGEYFKTIQSCMYGCIISRFSFFFFACLILFPTLNICDISNMFIYF